MPAPITRMRCKAGALVLALAILFLIANRHAYSGFFTDDDFGNLANARSSELNEYLHAFLKPNSGDGDTFRVAGYTFYFVAVRAVGLHYKPYVAAIQAVHLLNVFLIWMLARGLGAGHPGAAAAALLFSFHAATLDVYWKPMYAFDLLCGTFVLACLLAYVRGRILLSLMFFWIAYKCKEVIIFLPVALAAYEHLSGRRKWTRVIPFAAISAVLGLLALRFNVHPENDYTLHFTASALAQCAKFYAQHLMFVPYLSFAVLALPFLRRDRNVWLGMITFFAMLLPMLVLPGRLFGAYLYVPLIGLAVAVSSFRKPAWIAIVFVAWFAWNYHELRIYRSSTLASAKEREAWFDPVAKYTREHPEKETFFYDGSPSTLGLDGIHGALTLLRFPRTTLVAPVNSPEAGAASGNPKAAVMVWDWVHQRVAFRDP